MQNRTGRLICIEGTDGSGKGTQTKMLLDHLKKKYPDRTVKRIEFPQYKKSFFGRMVGEFLDGQFGELDQIHPKMASVIYACDRFEAKEEMEDLLNNGALVLCDRYVGSNIAYQSTRLPSEQRDEMRSWLHTMEHKVFGLPEPDMTIFLDVPVEVSQQLVLLKSQRDYTDKDEDIMEAKHDLLAKVYAEYKKLASIYEWDIINCMQFKEVKTLDTLIPPNMISMRLINAVEGYLNEQRIS